MSERMKLSDLALERYRHMLKHRIMTRQQMADEIGCSARYTYLLLPRIGGPRGPSPGTKCEPKVHRDEVDYDGIAAQRRAISEERRNRERIKRERLRAELEAMR